MTIKQTKKISQVCGAGNNFTSSLYNKTIKIDFFYEKKTMI